MDILWTVFDIVSDEDSPETSLDTLRHASQVSTAWRNLLLYSSSSLWGRLMNLDVLNERSFHWRTEVLRRSGDAPLYIHSRASERSRELEALEDEKFLETLIVDNWHRIKSLSIKIPFHLLLEDSPITGMLRVPAPLLQTFSVALHYRWNVPEDRTTHLVDFGGQAPYLRNFDANFLLMPNRGSWLIDLRTLCFKSHHTAHEMLKILRFMPSIESLEIFCANGHKKKDEAVSTSLDNWVGSKVALSRLKTISIHAAAPNWTDYFLFLENIGITASHCLEFEFRSHHTDATFPDISRLANILRNYMEISSFTEKISESRNRKRLRMSFNESSIYILTHNLELILEFSSSHVQYIITLIKQLSPYDIYWRHITHLAFILTPDILDDLLLPNSDEDQHLMRLLSHLTSVEYLEILDGDTMEYITNAQASQAELFPSLLSIELNNADMMSSAWQKLVRFLVGRKRPVKELIFTPPLTIRAINLTAFEPLDGLTIVWGATSGAGRREYICGHQERREKTSHLQDRFD